MRIPTIDDTVHYTSYGTPGGEYTQECRAATVTEVSASDPDLVGLAVLNPTGLFFHPLATGGCRHSDDPAAGGTWHWPEHIPAERDDRTPLDQVHIRLVPHFDPDTLPALVEELTRRVLARVEERRNAEVPE
jgi:hypothetical protein